MAERADCDDRDPRSADRSGGGGDREPLTRRDEIRSFLFFTIAMAASKEVWGKLFGTIDTREKFDANRLRLAGHEWERLEANNSLEYRNCHDFEFMDFTRQSPRASQAHSTLLAKGEKTYIDCHKGIAHRLPNMATVKP